MAKNVYDLVEEMNQCEEYIQALTVAIGNCEDNQEFGRVYPADALGLIRSNYEERIAEIRDYLITLPI